MVLFHAVDAICAAYGVAQIANRRTFGISYQNSFVRIGVCAPRHWHSGRSVYRYVAPTNCFVSNHYGNMTIAESRLFIEHKNNIAPRCVTNMQRDYEQNG